MTCEINGKRQTLSKLLDATVERRTDKAMLIDLTYSGSDGELRGARLWFPRSQVIESEEGIFVADWLLTKKAEELPLARLCTCRIEVVNQ